MWHHGISSQALPACSLSSIMLPLNKEDSLLRVLQQFSTLQIGNYYVFCYIFYYSGSNGAEKGGHDRTAVSNFEGYKNIN